MQGNTYLKPIKKINTIFCWVFTFSLHNISFILKIKKASHFIPDCSNSLGYFFLILDSFSQVSSSI